MTINNNINTEINASTYTAISIPVSPFVRPISYYSDDDLGWYEADDDSGTNETLLTPKTKVNQRTVVGNTTGPILYVKATAGTPNLVVKIGIPER